MNWIEYHTDTRYSDILSFLGAEDVVYTCAQNNCKAVAITDRNTVQGYLIAEREAKKRGISLIYGMTVDCLDREDRYAVTLLAKNRTGRENIFALLRLMDDMDLSQGRYVTRQQLEARRDGLLLGASARDGQLVRAIQLRRGDIALKNVALTYDYIELPLEPYDVSARLCRLSHESGVPTCAVQCATFAGAENAYYHAHRAITQYWGKSEEAFSWKKPEELIEDFRELYILPDEREIVEKALADNQQWIFDQIEPMPTMVDLMQRGQEKFHQERMAKLRQDVQAALVKKYGPDVTPAIQERMVQELDDIDRAGAAGIIHILQEIRLALPKEEHPIMLSAFWNSFLLLYLLDITDFDPLPQTLSPTGCDLLNIPGCYGKGQLCNIEISLSGDAYSMAVEHLGKACASFLAFGDGCNRSTYETKFLEDIMQNYLSSCPKEERSILEKDGVFFSKVLTSGNEKQRDVGMQQFYILPDMDGLPAKFERPFSSLGLDSFETGTPRFRLIAAKLPYVVEACQEATSVCRDAVPLKDPAIYQAIRTCHSKMTLNAVELACIIAGIGPARCFADMAESLNLHDLHSLIRVHSLSHGTDIWENCQKPMLLDGTITAEQVITCREDVYRYLVRRGATQEESTDFMTCVRMGIPAHKGFSEPQLKMLRCCEAEEWFTSVCKKTGYLFPEGHTQTLAAYSAQLVWYAMNYPDTVEPILRDAADDTIRRLNETELF